MSQIIYERTKYRSKKFKKIWKSVNLSKNQKRKIDQFYKENYGKKIPYTYHRLFMAYTGIFDEKIVPEMLYAPYLERFLTNSNYGNTLSDKNLFYILKNMDLFY